MVTHIDLPRYIETAGTPEDPAAAVDILNAAAKDLADKTDGYVLGSVFLLHPADTSLFRYTFYLRVPKLDDYTDPLFYVWHDQRLYPATLLPAGGKQGVDDLVCDTPAQLENHVNQLFKKPEVTQLITTLIKLARAQKGI